MSKFEYTCMMCCEKATKKLHHEEGDGFFILCDDDKCKEDLLEQLKIN